jgi:tripartite-type tricarboxylate transporter receptor subunit TctC
MRLLKPVFAAFAVFAVAALACAAAPAHAQAGAQTAYPSKMIRIVNPFSVGGPTDVLARLLADQFGERWHQTVLVESKPGAGGNIAMEFTAKAPADGHTLVVAPTGTLVINPYIFTNLRYDPFRDFAPVSLMVSINNVMVIDPKLPAANLKEFIAYAKANPGKIGYGSPGTGTQPHLAGEMFALETGIQIFHVPYKGTPDAMTAIMGGQIGMMLAQISAVTTLVESGRLRAIGIASKARSPLLPAVATIDEQGLKGFESASIYALMAPAGTPRPVIARIAEEVARTFNAPAVQKKIAAMGMDVVAGTPEQLAEWMRVEAARYERITKAANIRAD